MSSCLSHSISRPTQRQILKNHSLTNPKSNSNFFYDRQSVCQALSVSGTHLNTLRQLGVYRCGAHSLTRGRVCSLQLLLALTRVITFGSETRTTHDHILPSQILDSLSLERQNPVFIILQKYCGPVISPGSGFLVCRLFWLPSVFYLTKSNFNSNCLVYISACSQHSYYFCVRCLAVLFCMYVAAD
jgi:hypothetical protein